MWQVIGGSGRMLFEGTKDQCEEWVAAGNVGGFTPSPAPRRMKTVADH